MVEITNYLDPNNEVDLATITNIANEHISDVNNLFRDLELTSVFIWGKAKDVSNINADIVSEKIEEIEELKRKVKNYANHMRLKFGEKKLTDKRIEEIIKSKDEYIQNVMEELTQEKILPVFEIAVEEKKKQKELERLAMDNLQIAGYEAKPEPELATKAASEFVNREINRDQS